ncbi:MAG TPA: ABC transporter ATP-binding protein [Steroidobacteraceae bacterium]|jgi:ABC-2 type transport system ATP-binding protein|nr:ABC transporter ATP-binding protein [Steroidobacteraceae bacterium]
MSEAVIEIQGLRKSFGSHAALDGLDLRVPAGSVFGFLGRNGAGKTTTIKHLLGLIRADGGSVRLFGQGVADAGASAGIRRRIGFVTEDKDLYPYMTVEGIIRFTRPFFPGWRRDLEQRYLDLFELPRGKSIAQLSKGMRSKLMMLLAISHGAELLILDEPMEGLDPVVAEQLLRELVAIAADQGTTIFFSSHQLADVEQIADHVAIIARGRSVLAGDLDDLKTHYQRLSVTCSAEPPSDLGRLEGVESVQRSGRMLSILVSRNADSVVAQLRQLPGAAVERFPVTLKEVFLEHVGESKCSG